jgi:hypothetical protein
VRSAPPPSWLVDAASLEEAVTLAKGCRVSRAAVVSRLASSASQRVSGSADLRVLEDTVKRDQRVFDAQARWSAIAGAIVREGHLDPSQVARPAVLLVRTDECPLGISRGRTRGTATRPPNPGRLRELIDQILVSRQAEPDPGVSEPTMPQDQG